MTKEIGVRKVMVVLTKQGANTGDGLLIISFRLDDGFTLTEMIMVLIIFGIVSTVAIPKFINLRDEAISARCAANRGAINSAIATVYSSLAIQDPSQADWLRNATVANLDDSMFATGVIPVCPSGGEFSLQLGQVKCTVHGM